MLLNKSSIMSLEKINRKKSLLIWQIKSNPNKVQFSLPSTVLQTLSHLILLTTLSIVKLSTNLELRKWRLREK